ncbi:hypothetical protein [Cupriavidus sp. CP313]
MNTKIKMQLRCWPTLPGVVLALAATAFHADGYASQTIWQVTQPTRFMVAGVLRKDGTMDVIKPVHAIVEADSQAEAISQLTESAQRKYPGYTLISTLASPVPLAGKCEISI